MRLNVRMHGLDKVMRKIAVKETESIYNVDKITETYTRKMANESAQMAPVKSGNLRASITASPRRLEPGLWQYGSNLAYARRQEYEHRSRKGFIRKSVWNNRSPYREAVKREVTKK